jgi:hypothetical protein
VKYAGYVDRQEEKRRLYERQGLRVAFVNAQSTGEVQAKVRRLLAEETQI